LFSGIAKIGSGIEFLQIDPFNSNHFLYGTGLALMGSLDLLKWVRRYVIYLFMSTNTPQRIRRLTSLCLSSLLVSKK
jgi:hypothetical protein